MDAVFMLPLLVTCLTFVRTCASDNELGDCTALAGAPSQRGSSLLQIGTSQTKTRQQRTTAHKPQLHSKQRVAGSCSLPQLAIISSVIPKDGACRWTPRNPAGRSTCKYDLIGKCKRYHHRATGCDFFGKPPSTSSYTPANLVLPGPVSGEVSLSSQQEALFLKLFERCDSRPTYFLVSSPPLGTPKQPLALLAGGTKKIAQHFYFVAGEVTGNTSYHLGDQKEEDMQIIVDIGANIGLFSITACKLFPRARILAFEPHPANFRFLKVNLAAAGCDHVETYNLGLSKDARVMDLFWIESIGTSAYRKSDSYVRMQTIAPEALWHLVGSDSVSLMKVDCEGCEYEIVPLIQKWRVRQLYCEVHGATVKRPRDGNMSIDASNETMRKVAEICKDGNPFNAVVRA